MTPGPTGPSDGWAPPGAPASSEPPAPGTYAPQPYAQQPYAQPPAQTWPPAAPPQPQGPPDADQPRTYPQLLRGPRHRWWRPLVGLAVAAGAGLLLFVLIVVASGVGMVVTGSGLDAMDTDEGFARLMVQPWFFALNNLTLAAFIPLSVLAVLAGHGWRPGFVASVVGRVRWRWMLTCLGATLVIQVVAMGGLVLVDGVPSGRAEEHAVALLLVVLLTTPLQCAGEEYLARGWMTQAIGSWIRHATLGAVVPAVVTALVFGLMHGFGDDQGLLLFLDRFAFGLLASYLTWRTGGLEAAIAAHTANNAVVFVPAILTGSLGASMLSSEAPWELVAFDVVIMLVVAAVVAWLARRTRVQRVHDPARQPGQPVLVGPVGYR